MVRNYNPSYILIFQFPIPFRNLSIIYCNITYYLLFLQDVFGMHNLKAYYLVLKKFSPICNLNQTIIPMFSHFNLDFRLSHLIISVHTSVANCYNFQKCVWEYVFLYYTIPYRHKTKIYTTSND